MSWTERKAITPASPILTTAYSGYSSLNLNVKEFDFVELFFKLTPESVTTLTLMFQSVSLDNSFYDVCKVSSDGVITVEELTAAVAGLANNTCTFRYNTQGKDMIKILAKVDDATNDPELTIEANGIRRFNADVVRPIQGR